MKIAAIIPAYNEGRTVSEVVSVLKSIEEIDDVLVVSDGSADNTAAAARDAGARVLDLPRNLGKGGAMKAGMEETSGDVILFLDADLIGLTRPHVRELLSPVLSGDADMAIGIFDGGRAVTDIAQVVAPYLSGQRAVRASVLDRLSQIDLAKFGVEIALTRCAKREKIKVVQVPLKGLTHVMKEEKMGLSRGFVARMRMYWDIIRAHAVGR